eukprot:TRINITY_DN13060_c1_g1_i1.p1 TRINITY_DN13060_c1_g1~~TRINITY_DN13060_c1_g1_i1.p1  ORF type:complete len:126 (-),score=13.13 TRINITY_DN13060_c1_g1_i1:1120-1497(-)
MDPSITPPHISTDHASWPQRAVAQKLPRSRSLVSIMDIEETPYHDWNLWNLIFSYWYLINFIHTCSMNMFTLFQQKYFLPCYWYFSPLCDWYYPLTLQPHGYNNQPPGSLEAAHCCNQDAAGLSW